MTPEMSFREHVTGAALEILLEMLSLFDGLEGHIQFDLPRRELGSVRTLARIVIDESLTKVRGVPDISSDGMTQALDHIGVKHGLPSIAWNPAREKSSFAKPMEDILRLKPSRCSDSKRRMVESGGYRALINLLAGQVHYLSATTP